MTMQSLANSLPELTSAWMALQTHAQLRPIRDDVDFARMQAYANLLADSVGDDEEHPLYSLFEIVMELIERWEAVHVTIPTAPPREVLRFLLEANGLKQKDLAEIASKTLVSDILAGRREISKRLAKSLAARFHVDIGAFI
jgi:HTH-type transcriptional regulator/antitoxin HigA